MPIVPGYSTMLENSVNAILSSANRENLPLLYPDPGELLDTTSTIWFKFLSDLSLVIPSILAEGWVHDWPTYRPIPDHFKERWFLQLAFGHILILWPERYFVARCAISRVWRDLVYMFKEFGPDNFGF
ncbi:hypothetical protein Bca101_072613 [Brassica carinata]